MEVEEVELINSSDEEEDDDMVALELLPNGRRDMRHAAINMVVSMRGVAAMTRVGVRRAMSGADLVLRVNNLSLKQDVTAYLDRTGQRNHPRAVDLLRKFDNVDPFHGIKSNQGQISGIKKYYDFIAPSTFGVGNRLDQRLVGEGGAYGMVEVPNTFEFCSVIEFLKMLLRKPEVMDYVRNRRPSENGMLESYMDGSEFREHPFFQNFPDAFQLVLYGDGVDPARMAGPKSGLHEMYCFSISVLNLPPYLFYSGESIFPMEIANAQDCTDTFEGVLTPFVNELLRLEEGVRVFIGGEFIMLRATLVSVKGDGKAIHEMLGMLTCSARHFCPQCMISRQELHLGQVAVGETRTPAMSDAQLQRVAQNPAYSTQCGLRYRPVLHNSAYFRAENNGNFDLMHDGPEGVIMMLIRLCLRKWIVTDGIFTVEQLNGRILAFDYGQQNSKDKPTPNFTLESLQNAETTYTQKMNAGQTLVLFRALPFIIDNLGAGVDEDDEHLQYLLLLSEIFQTGSAPRIPQGVIPHLRRMLETFRRGWYVLFPNIDPINRFHHLMHLWENIERKGPQRQFWCFREEGKNCPVKRHVAVCNNFINPPKTAMEQCQIRVSKVWGTRHANVRDNRTYVRRENVYVLATPARAHLHALGFRDNDQISVCRAVTVWGFSYRIGEFLLYSRSCENNDGLPRFGRIVSIYCPDGTDYVWFALKPWRTVGLDDRFNAYSVAEFEPPPTHLVDVKDLPIHPAISRWTDYSTDQSFLCLKYKVY
ncbi:uncharacterized protein LOC117652599 isoform X1 [Thrips palmi]|uniref:Uncharacterized protein LOC117652599 isoform X1 n=1 Tax=Thrips palmi TaxID=161013 RepID=A0A6P9A6J4_THRPL|nr:uncharacterized protein LOC117652599 isoform X1 [Thrips palmi]XP_034253528.1 uncharacterized protein LOC117652599 isoform X1 [Thrips palmi]